MMVSDDLQTLFLKRQQKNLHFSGGNIFRSKSMNETQTVHMAIYHQRSFLCLKPPSNALTDLTRQKF